MDGPLVPRPAPRPHRRYARRRPGIHEQIEATITRGPQLDERVEEVFDRLGWLASAWRA
jgi:hypothetical protein